MGGEEEVKKILGLTIAVVLVIGLVAGGTWAVFSDTETSTGNVFTAGVIDLEVDAEHADGTVIFSAQDDPLPEIFNYLPANDIKPGDSGEVTISLHLKADSNNADLWMKVINLVDAEVTTSEPECVCEGGTWNNTTKECEGAGWTPVYDISTKITVKLWIDDGDNVYEPDTPELETYFYDGPLSGLDDFFAGLTDGQYVVKADAVASTTYYVGWSWTFDSATNNCYQGDECKFDIVFGADQITP